MTPAAPGAPSVSSNWTPAFWQSYQALQQPCYEDTTELNRVIALLAELPPLVTSWEVLTLKQHLAQAQEGRCFLLQGGDCAESFADCTSPIISNRLKVLMQMSLILIHGLKKPVLRVGRFAGQYAKPRSTDTETRGGLTLPSFRGDVINGSAFTAKARRPDPQRLIRAHACSALAMNFMRSLIHGRFADLKHPEYWNLKWVEYSTMADEYYRIINNLGNSLRFMESLGGSMEGFSRNRMELFCSHEALLLHYEQAVTRQVPTNPGWFNLSTHFPWIGMRTASPDGAHVAYVRGICNPVAVKVGPSVTPDQLLTLIDVLNPHDEPGRLTLIHRMGHTKITQTLPSLLEAVKREGRRVLWVADPMHGNTEVTSNGYKTRRFDTICSELDQAFDIHAAAGTRLGGVHLELTGEDVTECLGGARGLSEPDLERAYRSMVDPRLNYEQSLELSLLIVRKSCD